ncbi:SAM-dependent methyltransferase [soil metagenome]
MNATPLERIIAAIIREDGPMPLERYMALCLGHPHYGYYMTRDPLGADGDFITAPEISQIFGELIGIWAVAMFQQMGEPSAFNLIELGPGRGTLLADMLRAAAKVPAFRTAARIHLVETSPALRKVQARTLGDGPAWHDDLGTVPPGPSIIIANEFFDALPIRQYECRSRRWMECVVGLKGEEKLIIGLVASDLVQGPAPEGTIIELAPMLDLLARAMGERLAGEPGAALIIDYGHVRSAPGDTLQAVRHHRYQGILEYPGEADLTSHVDFEALASSLSAGGAGVSGPMTQGDFLRAMGLEVRAAALGTRTGAAEREIFAAAVERLAHADQMGNLFKVLAAVSPGLTTPFPFGSI